MVLTGSMPMTPTAAEPKEVLEQTSGEDGLDEEQDPETGDQTGEEDSSAENQNGEKEPSEGDLTVEEYPDEEAADSPARNDGAADIYAPVEDETDNSITSDRQMTNNLLADSQAHDHNDVHFDPGIPSTACRQREEATT